ncbi:hypothetical protein E5Q_02305 [Mixia osmundae IAM 14324]|uniref:Uncharacterized protein n=2 Tax=Mixia osmundae (strain CBS 9802 / IAM 14324 / JCM 22182 / KY 12970) TaxID=764103 RepID=G7DYI9_MIXOS|nr:hypothetical protein E5Q_02305 [Mixia osmundae IAM 14324]
MLLSSWTHTPKPRFEKRYPLSSLPSSRVAVHFNARVALSDELLSSISAGVLNRLEHTAVRPISIRHVEMRAIRSAGTFIAARIQLTSAPNETAYDRESRCIRSLIDPSKPILRSMIANAVVTAATLTPAALDAMDNNDPMMAANISAAFSDISDNTAKQAIHEAILDLLDAHWTEPTEEIKSRKPR